MSEARTGEGAAADAAAQADTGAEAEILHGEVVEERPAQTDGADAPATDDASAAAAEDEAQETERAAEDVEADLSALEDTKRERDEYLDLAQRTRADFENFRKRAAVETTAARVRGKVELAKDLVGVIDNLERGLQAASLDPQAALAGEADAEGPLEQGIVLTYRELHAVLQRAGVVSFDPAGEKFDPTWHEALQTRPEEGVDAGAVVETLQKGYRIDDQLIRAARVVVSA
jgi:molecular chaperone GrpE